MTSATETALLNRFDPPAGDSKDNQAVFDGTVYFNGTIIGAGTQGVTVVSNVAGALYNTVKAALADGKKNIVVAGVVTETANITSTDDFTVNILEGSIWDLDNYPITLAVSKDIAITGAGVFTYSLQSAGAAIRGGASGENVGFVGGGQLTIINESAQANSPLHSGQYLTMRVDGVKQWVLPDFASCGFVTTNTKNSINNVVFQGQSASCSIAVDYTNGATFVTNITFTGTYGSNSVYLVKGSTRPVVENLIVSSVTATSKLQLPGYVSSILSTNGALTIEASVEKSSYAEIDTASGVFTIGTGISNIHVEKLYTNTLVPSTTSKNCNFYDVDVTAAFTANGTFNTYHGSRFVAGITVPSAMNDNGFSQCITGDGSGGGTATITVASGANRTRITGCATDAALSDSGTSTAAVGNTVY